MSKLIAYVGSGSGGIEVFEIGEGGKTITPLNNGVQEPGYARLPGLCQGQAGSVLRGRAQGRRPQ